MSYLYLTCLIISVGMLFWLKLFDVRNSTTQYINLLAVVVSNLGFYFVSISESIGEAILSQKIAYVGGIFLPPFYLLLVLEILHINTPKWVSAALMSVQCILYAMACTIGKGTLFYKSVEAYVKNGIIILKREYGPLHTIYLLVMLVYLVIAIAVSCYAVWKKKSVDKKSVIAMIAFAVAAIATYIFEKAIHLEFEIVPIAYIVLMIGTLIPVYDSNIYTVYENKEIINEQLDRVGFLTFDKKWNYKGCDNFMADVFPELANYRIGQRIGECSKELQAIIDQIAILEKKSANKKKDEHNHIQLKGFLYNNKFYSGMIHSVTNTFGTLKGYTVELRDDTDHYKALTLQERYNEELSQEVHDKTKRIRYIQQKTIMGMAQMVESRDLSTGGHIKRTSDVVRIFSKKLKKEKMGFDGRFLNLVIRSAPMHDLGKIGVDDAILRKQGRFTDDEYNAMKKHAEIGYHMVGEILSEVEEPDFVTIAENVAHYHHEKVNGTGYPVGLKGDDIPVEARIMALADVFDALVSKRCYKEAFSYDDAFAIIEKDAGSHFDSELARVFLMCRPELEEYYNKSEE